MRMIGLNRWLDANGERMQFEILYSQTLTSAPRKVTVSYVNDDGENIVEQLSGVRVVGRSIRGWSRIIEEDDF